MSEESNIPNVFPTKEQMEIANKITEERNRMLFEQNQQMVSSTEQSEPIIEISPKLIAAEQEMIRRTEEQKKLREEALREQAIRAAKANDNYLKPLTPDPRIANKQPSFNINEPISSVQNNAPYDLIPLPSQGLIYPSKKARLKVAYLNASDENILTSPHLLESGEFLNIILERKILDKDIRPSDLHVGDRNAIMIWLRATAYGTNYPIQVINPSTGELIETEIDLSDIKEKKLGAVPDENGYFDFSLPVSGKKCKFKLLTVGDIEDISQQNEYELNTLNKEYAESYTYTLEKQIVEIDGITDKGYIKDFISIMRVGDSRAFKKYVNEIESGMDLNITVQVPGGEPFTTFLPINRTFFWPEL